MNSLGKTPPVNLSPSSISIVLLLQMKFHQLGCYRRHHHNVQVYVVICIISPRRIFYAFMFSYQRQVSCLARDNPHSMEIIEISKYTILYIIIPERFLHQQLIYSIRFKSIKDRSSEFTLVLFLVEGILFFYHELILTHEI